MKAAEENGICWVEKTAKLLSDTWTMLIMRDLLSGPKRFCELERSLEGISTRTLTNKLRKLEEERMVKKTKDGAYEATEKGKGLRTVENAMRVYGEKYL
jgi:DNA-binding HxlR family transcriptional regulator